jgi:enolase
MTAPTTKEIVRRHLEKPARLQEGWVIANHILVSFHVAFISSVLALPAAEIMKGEVLKFIFVSPETIVSAIFLYISFHAGIALHEIGHYLTAAKLSALNESSQRDAERLLRASPITRMFGLLRVFALAPYGKAIGIKREGLNYYPDAAYNLAVAAAGPRMSRNVAALALPPAVLLLAIGLIFEATVAVYIGRLLLGIGIVSLLDFLLADPGKYREFRDREKAAAQKAATVVASGAWLEMVAVARDKMVTDRVQEITHPRLGPVTAPWQFRNCGMGGRHTEKEYPESNVSMQEAMFLILGARDYQEAQEMTVRLQNRLKEIIEKSEGGRVMGIGLEGGLAPYIERGEYPLPEVRLWAMMKQTMQECGYRPGVDVAIALDPAMSELENAYRDHFKVPDAVGMYLFWRDKTLTVMDRDQVLDLYVQAIEEYDIPILSIEDGFSEDDFEGWKQCLDRLGDRVFVIGDDLVTTNDATIELASSKGLINAALIKANQIGSLYETIVAMLVALGKGMELVVSHRSKSPNDDMEAQIALAVNSLGLKCGGGANTERLIKYQAINEVMQRGAIDEESVSLRSDQRAVVHNMFGYEEPTNAGIPTVGATVELLLPDAGVSLKFRGATPLGTSAGTGEAIHLVDSRIERAEHREAIDGHPTFFREVEHGVYSFKSEIGDSQIKEAGDHALTKIYARSQRYNGKGCLNAADNVREFIGPAFAGRPASAMTMKDIDRTLLSLELNIARRRGKISENATAEEQIAVMQRKQNLGMNAMLSISLALARAVAHLQGKDLYEILREEICAITERVARDYGVTIEGINFSDYVDALRKVNAKLEAQDKPLYEVLRDITDVYVETKEPPTTPRPTRDESPATTRDTARRESDATSPGSTEAPASSDTPDTAPPKGPSSRLQTATATMPPTPVISLTEDEQGQVAEISLAFRSACLNRSDRTARHHALYHYRILRQSIGERVGRFAIANHRVFLSSDTLFVPYVVADTLLVHKVTDDNTETVFERPVPVGKIITDDVLRELTGLDGEVIDFEPDLSELTTENAGVVHVTRIRDMVEQLKRINHSVNRNESVFVLRCLVARLSLFSFKQYLSAKNLQSEVHNALKELTRFVNTMTSARRPFLLRMLIRNITSVISKPKLIDRMWNDTIDLAEIHVRGSDIVNELRRSSHHAIGRHTLTLARAYQTYINTGDATELAGVGYPVVGPADEAARQSERPKQLLTRVIHDLEDLLGTSETVSHIREWQADYEAALGRCEFGRSLVEEMDAAITGIRTPNRWTYYHHLRIVKSRVAEFVPNLTGASEIARRLDALLQLKPDEESFDADAAEAELRDAINQFSDAARATYQEELFDELEGFLTLYQQSEYRETFAATSRLRKRLRVVLGERAFPEQRLLIYQLDCLLEEMGYIALRQVATEYGESGVDLGQCLEIIHSCVLNLTHDGLYSRQFSDLTDMLRDPTRTYAEICNVLEQIQRNYQHIVRRVISPFEKMQQRLGFDDEELRIAMANMQRYMHDLNSIASFLDLALVHIANKIDDLDAPVGGGSATPDLQLNPLAVVHISHREEIADRIEREDGVCNLRDCYGGKGSGLLYISHLGLPTRDGFIMPTALARQGIHKGDDAPLREMIAEHLRVLEQDIAKRDGKTKVFGDPEQPLLVAVRGGSVFSMPGMLSTVVFVGMNDNVAESLAKLDPWCAYDSYRRFLASYAEAVWGVDMEQYSLVDETKRRYGVEYKEDLPWEGMKEIADETKSILAQGGHGDELEALLGDPSKQLIGAARAVFNSWDGEGARRYREIKSVCESWQTAVIIQEMALGNRRNDEISEGMDESKASLTGVIPRTIFNTLGVRVPTGDIKFSAHGDDLVAGLTRSISFRPVSELPLYMPMLDRALSDSVAALRRFMGTDQEVEFTVELGVLCVLQSRAAEIATNKRVVTFEDLSGEAARGVGVRGGAFRGIVAFDESDLKELAEQDLSKRDDIDGVLAVLENPSPDEIPLALLADGMLAAKGGSTSHAAIAVNGIEHRDYSAVLGVEGMSVNARKREAVITDSQGNVVTRIGPGDVVSIHGTTGGVYTGSRAIKSY